MPWTETTSAQYRRESLRYASDLTDMEWSLVAAHLRAARCWDDRGRSSFAMSWTRSCISRRPAASATVAERFPALFGGAGVFLRLARRGALANDQSRPGHGVAREGWPRGESDVIDSQSAKTCESGGPRGFDAGKKIMGRKRHIVTDTQGHLVGVVIHAADIQDRDGAPLALLRSARPPLGLSLVAARLRRRRIRRPQTRARPCWTRRLDRRNR